MQRVYDGLCALVSKRGICWQCAGLRDASPPERRGPPAPATLTWPERLRTVREANLDRGTARALHDVFFRHTEVQEREGRVASRETTLCGHPSDE